MIGEVRLYLGQRYVGIAEVPHTRRDGSETTLVRWQSHCADCGGAFSCLVPSEASRFQPNRRCHAHKRPGRRVRRRSAPPAMSAEVRSLAEARRLRLAAKEEPRAQWTERQKYDSALYFQRLAADDARGPAMGPRCVTPPGGNAA